MSDDVFYRLAPFIRDFIYKNNWTELRTIQVDACRVIFDTDNHLLLSSGTASGKTEAAFLPVLTKLHEDPPASVGVLYIAPIKALINDQFYRLNDLLVEANIPVWHWHGDVPASHKQKVMREPAGILQITPESLEGMLINKNRDLIRLFGDLRFIIIDEVHSFMGTSRGIQVQCQMQRLQRYMRCEPRRIGLSATLGDYTLAEKWLSVGSQRKVAIPPVTTGGQKIKLSVEHFYDPEPEDKNAINRKDEIYNEVFLKGRIDPVSNKTIEGIIVNKTDSGRVRVETDESGSYNNTSEILAPNDNINGNEIIPNEDNNVVNEELRASAYWKYLYEKSLNKKCIIFTNLRDHAETSIASLRQIAALQGTPDIYHVHHGSISASFRETAETEMKESPGPVVIGATLTLEMGIDIGRLERIIQIEAPNSVSGFLQRLGRSGRRGNPSEMLLVCKEEKPSGLPLLPDQVPWRFLQIISIIQLYLEERWIEPARDIKYPFNMLYHQTMSTLKGMGELNASDLASRVLNMEPFENVSIDDFRMLLHSLIEMDHVQQTEERGLIIGLNGEKIVNSYKFLAVFPEEDDYMVVSESKQLGKIEVPPPIGERMTLAGRNWEVLDVDMKRKTVIVKPVGGKLKTYWEGGSLKINNRVIENIRKVLITDTVYPYLQKGAILRLEEARFFARNTGLHKHNILSLGGKTACIFPWMGNVDYYTLLFLIKRLCGYRLNIKSIGGIPPYFILIRLGQGDTNDLFRCIKSMFDDDINLDTLLTEDDIATLRRNFEYKLPKYDEFIPLPLIKKSLINDYMDINGIRKVVDKWTCSEVPAGYER